MSATWRHRVKQYVDDYRVVLDARRAAPGLVGVTALMLVATSLDLLGIGLVAPFVALVVGSDAQQLPRSMAWLAGHFSLTNLGLVVVAVFVAKSILSHRLQKHIVRFAETHRARLMTRLLASFLARSYEMHLRQPTAARVTTLFWHTAQYSGSTLASSLRVVTDGLVLTAVAAMLWLISPLATMMLAGFLGVVSVAVAGWVRRELAESSQRLARAQSAALTAVENSMGAFREIRVLGTADAFRAALARAVGDMADAAARQHSAHFVPRVAVETALVAFLVALSLYSLRSGSGAQLVPVLGAMGVAAMRLMPIATSLLSSFNNLRASRLALSEIARELREAPALDESTTTAHASEGASTFKTLSLREIGYRYPDAERDSLLDVSLDLRHGEVLGIAGRSGAGKSTLIDVMLGLLTPRRGEVRVDGEAISLDRAQWHAQCAYIPQDVFLIAGSLRDNITFGRAEPRPGALADALRQARLEELIARLPQGVDTVLGERGQGLSGGQRQRVAIARALYHERDLLVMDEATSALDAETEAEVVAAIAALRGRRTVVVVAHRPSMLAACDRVIHLEEGRVIATPERVGASR